MGAILSTDQRLAPRAVHVSMQSKRRGHVARKTSFAWNGTRTSRPFRPRAGHSWRRSSASARSHFVHPSRCLRSRPQRSTSSAGWRFSRWIRSPPHGRTSRPFAFRRRATHSPSAASVFQVINERPGINAKAQTQPAAFWQAVRRALTCRAHETTNRSCVSDCVPTEHQHATNTPPTRVGTSPVMRCGSVRIAPDGT